MTPTPEFILTIPLLATQGIRDNRRQRTEVGQVTPQSVESAEVRGMQLARAARPEAFARVVIVPDVEVADLGAYGG